MSCEQCGCVTLRDLEGALVTCTYDEAYFLGSSEDSGYRDDYATDPCGTREATARAVLSSIQKIAPGAKRFLDVGCGAGYLVSAGSIGGMDARGIDTSESAVRLARKRSGNPDAFECVRVDELGQLGWGSFDVITMLDVIEHVADPIALLVEVARYVRRGGILLISTPRFGGWLYEAQGSEYVQFKADHVYYFTETTLRRVAERAGQRRWTMWPMGEFLSHGMGASLPEAVRDKYDIDRDHLVIGLRT
jgi:2-polyprenyl-3-methyl-5-hydroxy-6-metoxy-1,4-benzoquinol methylase